MLSGISLAVVLGSGLGDSIKELPKKDIISEDTQGIHKKLVFISEINGKKTLFFSGRKHFYEGFGLDEITANMKLASSMGVRNVLITNAAGGINPELRVSDMMLINSHLNLNQNFNFQKSHSPYSEDLYRMIRAEAGKLLIGMYEGTYCCSPGPMYETPAEIRALVKIGCDAVGMSTVPEVFAAKELGMSVAAISVITNLLKENDLLPPSHASVLLAASDASQRLFALIKNLVNELN